jgi:selenide,water dikinase
VATYLSTKPDRSKHEIVLLGAGHTNAHILLKWRSEPIPETRLTCVSDYPIATYSGMLPGVLAGLYPPEQMEIDLVRLCDAVGARLVIDRFTGIDNNERLLLFDDRAPVPFDVLSVGIGSVPARDDVVVDDTVLEIKPMQTFLSRFESRMERLIEKPRDEVLQVAIIGAGVAGIELLFCLSPRLKTLLNDAPFKLTLVDSGREVPRGTTPKTQKLVRQEIEHQGMRLRLGKRVSKVAEGEIVFDDGDRLAADLVLWATNAKASPALSKVDLPKDSRGFLQTQPTLQTTSGAPIFAVGDAGTIAGSKSPKAGVHAVRQGPILWQNISRLIQGRDLLEYHPQRNFLKLMNLGDGRAIAEYKGISTKGRLAWKLKDWIDRRFISKFQN